MGTRQLTRPAKADQVAAQMLLVFRANPNTVMTRMDIEAVLSLEPFSESTRQRALNILCVDGLIKWESPRWGGQPIRYWLAAGSAVG